MKRAVILSVLLALLLPAAPVHAQPVGWVLTNDAYALYLDGTTVALWIEVWCNPWGATPVYMLAQYRKVGDVDWIDIPPTREIYNSAQYWWTVDVLTGFDYEVRGAAYEGADWQYGNVLTLYTPGMEHPYVGTGSGWWTGTTTGGAKAYGSPGDREYAYLYIQYRDVGEVTWLETAREYVTDFKSVEFSLSGLDSLVGAEYRAALDYADAIIYGDIRELEDYDGEGLECETQPAGAGTSGNPYRITDICELQWMRNALSSYYRLENDIDATMTRYWNWDAGRGVYQGFVPVASFAGTLDGDTFTINNLYMDWYETYASVGLFGTFTTGATVQNLVIRNADITNTHRYVNSSTGVLVGRILNGTSTIYRVFVSGQVHSTFIGAYNAAAAGGLIGMKTTQTGSSNCQVDQCAAYVDVTLSAAGSWVTPGAGGFIGHYGDSASAPDWGHILDCYARGSVTASFDDTYGSGTTSGGTGGFAGSYTPYASASRISRVYSTGSVVGSGSVVSARGLVGRASGPTPCLGLTGTSFWDMQTSGKTTSACGTGKTTAEMKTKSTFTDAGWNFVNIWGIDPDTNDGYPCLLWAACGLKVQTEYPESIGSTSFRAAGTLTGADPEAFRAGFAYLEGVHGTPTMDDDVIQMSGSFGPSEFTAMIRGLVPGTAYRVRAFAESECAFAWGNVITVVTTSDPAVVTVKDEELAPWLHTWRRLFGFVEYDGGVYVEVRFAYGTNSVSLDKFTPWDGVAVKTCPQRGYQTGDEFFEDISGLEVCTTYYYQAQIWSEEAGVSGGEILGFSTHCPEETDSLVVVTHAATDYTGTALTAHGAITYANPNAFRRGFVYMLGGVGHPTVANSVVQQGGDFGAEAFHMSITGLNPDAQYRVRAFAESTVGLAYGDTITVPEGPEPAGVPVMATHAATHVGPTSFRAHGEIVSTGTPVTERGFVYMEGSVGTPTLADSVVDEFGTWGPVNYQSSITGLVSGIPHRVRAYGINSAGAGYGNVITVTTSGDAQVVTNAATNVGTTSAQLNGRLISDGGDHCQRRFQWGYATGVYTYASPWTNGLTSGTAFLAVVGDLSVNTTYHFRAQARNSAGTVSGDELTFTTGHGLLPPWPFSAQGISGTEINVTWTKGGGASSTVIQMAMGDYPVDINSGTRVYFDTGTHVIVPGLAPGMTYYFRAWSESGGAVSANYSQDLATTLAGDIDDEAPTVPPVPWGWFKAPSTDGISNAFFYPWVNKVWDKFELPYTTGWMGLILLLVALAGVGTLSISHNIWIALVVVGLGLFIAGIVCVAPMWPLIIVLVAGGSYAYIKSRP